MENRHSKWVNQINTWLFSISWKWLRKSTPTIMFFGFSHVFNQCYAP
jgi:hypothetical protein